jgi:hypothetical protein
LSIWGEEQLRKDGAAAEPVARFEGAREGVKEFVWRARGGNDLESGMSTSWISLSDSITDINHRLRIDDRQFQLVTWAKDRRLRLWPISEELTKVRQSVSCFLT